MEITIKEGNTHSEGFLLPDRMVGLSAPMAWNHANLCFRVSQDGQVWNDLCYEDGTVVQVAMQPPGTYMEVPAMVENKPKPPPPFGAGTYVTLVSGPPEQLVPQDSDRVFPVWTATPGAGAAKLHPEPHRHTREPEPARHARDSDRHK